MWNYSVVWEQVSRATFLPDQSYPRALLAHQPRPSGTKIKWWNGRIMAHRVPTNGCNFFAITLVRLAVRIRLLYSSPFVSFSLSLSLSLVVSNDENTRGCRCSKVRNDKLCSAYKAPTPVVTIRILRSLLRPLSLFLYVTKSRENSFFSFFVVAFTRTFPSCLKPEKSRRSRIRPSHETLILIQRGDSNSCVHCICLRRV